MIENYSIPNKIIDIDISHTESVISKLNEELNSYDQNYFEIVSDLQKKRDQYCLSLIKAIKKQKNELMIMKIKNLISKFKF